jgi:hypothetical protein
MAHLALKKIKEFFPKTVSLDQAKDTGMAMVLICLLIAVIGKQRLFTGLAILGLLVDMIWPGFFRPFGKVWFGVSRMLGAVMSRILFSLIFIVLVVPVGCFRKLVGKDPLQIKKWKSGRTSVLKVRDHDYVAADIAHPY